MEIVRGVLWVYKLFLCWVYVLTSSGFKMVKAFCGLSRHEEVARYDRLP